MNNYATIKDIEINQYLTDNGQRFRRVKDSCHPTMGRVKVFEAPTGERRIFQKSKDDQRVLVIDSQTFAL